MARRPTRLRRADTSGNLMPATYGRLAYPSYPPSHHEARHTMENILLIMIGSISAVAIILSILLTTKIINDDNNKKR
jgi:hypothetical protein